MVNPSRAAAPESFTERLARGAYTLLMVLLYPLLALYLLKRARLQPAYRMGWGQRFLAAHPAWPASAQPRIWVHAVSVGETHAVSALVKAYAQAHPNTEWLFSSTTPTGFETALTVYARLQAPHRHILFPYDLPGNWRRLFRSQQPDALWLVETELWPNLMAQAQRVHLPVTLINARVSEKTARGLRRFSWLSRPAWARMSRVVAQTSSDASRIASICPEVPLGLSGNLKFDVSVSDALLEQGRAWRAHVGSKPVVMFASAREGEEALALQAWNRFRMRHADLPCRLLIVPRHPQRFDEVARLIERTTGPVARRSEGWQSLPAEAVLLGDSMGEMPAYYAMSAVCMIGGSWLPLGGQNLIEACACACPVVMGPHMFNFLQAAQDAKQSGAAVQVSDWDEALAVVEPLLRELLRADSSAQQWSQRARAFAQAHTGAVQLTLQQLGTVVKNG